MITFEHSMKINDKRRSFSDIVAYVENREYDTKFIFNTGEIVVIDDGKDSYKIQIILASIDKESYDFFKCGDLTFYLKRDYLDSKIISIIMDILNTEIMDCLNMLSYFSVKKLSSFNTELTHQPF